MAKVYMFLADGFEQTEALAPVDVLRRGGVDVVTVSISDSLWVESSHGVTVSADAMFDEINLDDADLLMLPGGMPGSVNLDMHAGVRSALTAHASVGKMIGAICAAPMVLGRLGLLKGKAATCYPGFEKYLDGATYTADLVTVCGNITTGKGPAASLPYAYSLLSQLVGTEKAQEVADGMMWPSDI